MMRQNRTLYISAPPPSVLRGIRKAIENPAATLAFHDDLSADEMVKAGVSRQDVVDVGEALRWTENAIKKLGRQGRSIDW